MRALVAFVLCFAGVVLGMFSFAATSLSELESPPSRKPTKVAQRHSTPTPDLFRPGRLPAEFVSKASRLPPAGPLPLGLPNGRLDPLRAPFSVDQPIDAQSRVPTAVFPNMPTAPAAAGIWSIVPSPNGGNAPTTLSAITCLTVSDCWAVGRTEIGQTFANTALMHWDGNSWEVVPSPSVEKQTNGLVAITCNSTVDCWAVGYRILLQTIEVQTLILHWDGVAWQIVPSPNIGDGFNALHGVACTSESDCWAVGFENGSNRAKTLIHKWDGISWTVHDSPNVGNEHNVLNAVTCLSAEDCWAVGYTGVEGARNSLVARWDGTAWTASALPNQLAVQENTLSSVACNSLLDCWAVGDSFNGTVHQTLIERWDGTSWANIVSPNPGVDNYLSHVACASTSDCWAVGHSSNDAIDPQLFDQDLILHWNGSAWLLHPDLPDPDASYDSELAGVACASGSACWAVGSVHPAGSGRPHIARWDATSWTSIVAPDVPALPSNFLHGVTCVSASDCWAVGFNFYGNIARSQTMHWDGASWEIVESANTALDRSNYLADVDCLSSSDCWAVGQSSNTVNRDRQAMSMHWNGTAWSIVTPAPLDTSLAAETVFEAVSCISETNCWAVGFSLAQDYQGLIQHWNGAAWELVPTPPMPDPTSRSIFYDVACTGTSDCTAVGVQWTTALTGSALYQTLIAHWDGASWSVVLSPNTSTEQDNILSAVACVSATDCWAVGSSNNYSEALILRWNGTSWSIVSAPGLDRILSAVTCLSASDCWAAGPYYTPNPPAKTQLVHWDGTTWTEVASPNTSLTDSNNLAGIACASSSDCWAVGQYWRKGSPQTLTLHYAALPVLKILSITPAGKGVLLKCLGVPNAVNRIEVSDDLNTDNFTTTFASPTADSNGLFEVTDSNPGNLTKRFYRLAYP